MLVTVRMAVYLVPQLFSIRKIDPFNTVPLAIPPIPCTEAPQLPSLTALWCVLASILRLNKIRVLCLRSLLISRNGAW